MTTKERLAQALHAVDQFDLEARARRGEFDDFESASATPKIDLYQALSAVPLVNSNARQCHELALRVRDGQFDNTKEEAEAWANPSNRDLRRREAQERPRRRK
jgi:D-Tyr-tRNAtyr deacylase